MSATILDGKALKQEILEKLHQKVQSLDSKPGLAAILVGDDPSSHIYLYHKAKACQKIGYIFQKHELPSSASKDTLISLIQSLNADPQIHSIIVQLPLPPSLSEHSESILNQIDPIKDVDGLHPLSQFTPATPKGIIRLLDHYRLNLSGKHAVVIGRSKLVGQPISHLLLAHDATVTMTHSKTQDLPEYIHQADVVVAAIGIPKFIQGNWIKKNTIIIDVGITRTKAGIIGDIDFDSASKIASYITPVPGGVGPMTIAMLMENVFESYCLQSHSA